MMDRRQLFSTLAGLGISAAEVRAESVPKDGVMAIIVHVPADHKCDAVLTAEAFKKAIGPDCPPVIVMTGVQVKVLKST